MEIFTIGFTQSSAEHFFGRIKQAGVKRLLDVRLNNRSQLAGFAKQNDLKYFLRQLCDADYEHEPRLAPDKEILDAYKKKWWFVGRLRRPVYCLDAPAKNRIIPFPRRLRNSHRPAMQ